MRFLESSEELERYLEQHSTPESDVLKELNRYTHLNSVYPQMLSGPILGGFLRMLSQMIGPKNILEIGTFTGYSAICLAEGLRPGGKLITIEINDEYAEIANHFFKKACLEQKIELIRGDALAILPTLDIQFDLVFIDANKDHYTDYYNLIIEKVASRGYIIADNVLWGGKAIGNTEPDRATEAIRRFNLCVTEDKRVENVILTVRDGLMVIKKY